jgi:replicative DNA helicase
MLEGVRDTRAQLKEARRLIERVKDRSRREQLDQAAQQVDAPLIQATQAGHSFVYDNLDERLGVAQRRLSALFEALANPR